MLVHPKTMQRFILSGNLDYEGYADDFLVDTLDDLISIKRIILKNGMIGCRGLENNKIETDLWGPGRGKHE